MKDPHPNHSAVVNAAPGHPTADGHGQRATGKATSVGRQRDAESFRLLVDSVQDYAIFMLDPGGTVVTWNAGARNIKGYTADEMIGQHFSKFYPEAENLAGKWQLELEIATAVGRFEEEGIRLRKDGSTFWANVVITALRDATGTLVGFAKVTRDLTARVLAERQRIALAQAEEANRVKDEFMAMLSHELRTPLTPILGWTAVLMARAGDDAQLQKGLSIIRRNAQTQARLIEDMLDVSRIVLGMLRLEVKPADLSVVVRDALEVVRPAADAKKVEIRFDRFDEPVPLVGDETRLQQVVWNLLTNAVKFTDAGGSVFVRLEQEGSSIRLSIRDTGRGIDPAFLPHVFERFRQADAPSTRSSGGLGLGLAIVRHLVELHGGTVTVESEGKDMGATFCVSLPVRALSVAPELLEVAVVTGPHSTLGGVRVLVVDDESDARELLAALLSYHGAEVEMAESAEEAFGIVTERRPDVIVSDIGMPGEGGYELMRRVRALPADLGGRTAAIGLTAGRSRQHRRNALEAGFTTHTAKPVDPDELVGMIGSLAAIVGASRARR